MRTTFAPGSFWNPAFTGTALFAVVFLLLEAGGGEGAGKFRLALVLFAPLLFLMGFLIAALNLLTCVYLANLFFPVTPSESPRKFFMMVAQLGFLWGYVESALINQRFSATDLFLGGSNCLLALVQGVAFWNLNRKPRTEDSGLAEKPGQQARGRCPNCDANIYLHSQECERCKALFGNGSTWQVKPITPDVGQVPRDS